MFRLEVEQFPLYATGMRKMTLEEEVVALRAEVTSLKEQVGVLLAANAQLRAELDKYRNEPPSFVKPNTATAPATPLV